ncbi:TRAP transporter fused permease subunit [Paracoccus sp. MBLB3053]|uniref:TRAP transporter fused permease subunit n=1 Tax=Paracoccus aurantius TaxID=3073814 RepID=A0ABU2HUP1_9RHOB|nr:TRAP transporter fused permease subunit [Paracoccus sp. MBLB3053]MDS9468766.1 TRAP transporter fused permease subunit [Paracoccus sp. MBLB3053]
MDDVRALTQAELEAIERKYDEGAATRALPSGTSHAIRVLAIGYATYHFLTAGFGLPADHWHMGIHLAGLCIFIYALFPAFRGSRAYELRQGRLRPCGIPILDLVLMTVGVLASLYLGLAWKGIPALGIEAQTFRMGNPNGYDLVMGAALIVLVLDMARRTLGWVLPAIISVFIAYALLGPHFPGLLQHPGVKLKTFISSMYFPQEGIFGVTLWVVSTVVFHFVLFGVIAQKTGLGQLFIDNATMMAGRYAGGPAKVSVLSSAFFGMISGSSVANTVSTGSLTIPNMKRLGYPAHFAGGVEAASSAGGQITPPIMGAAAFIMAEFLRIPYTTIVIAAIVPAMMHYAGVLTVVHLMARKLGLKAVEESQMPRLREVWRAGWANMIPLLGLLVVLFSGFTPYLAAFCGISLAMITALSRWTRPATLALPALFITFILWKSAGGDFPTLAAALMIAGALIAPLNRQKAMNTNEMVDALALATTYALAVGAASAAVGIVVGVINTTGIGFRLGFMVTQGASALAGQLHGLLGFGGYELFAQADLQLFISLVLIAIACILMGAGIPTTALYIMLASVAQPTLAQLGVPPIASHLFILYYGVVSEITPPVCTSAYAAAAIANANPFRTGMAAFGLGLGKILAPMAFVYAPVLLIVSDGGFQPGPFAMALTSCLAGVLSLSAAVVGHWRTPLVWPARIVLAVAGLVFVAPSWQSNAIGMALVAPILLHQLVLTPRRAAIANAR